MAKRSRKRQSSIAITIEAIEKLAAEFVSSHEVWMNQGYKLTGACRLWRRNDGSWTGRFVYRGESGGIDVSVVHTVRGIRFA